MTNEAKIKRLEEAIDKMIMAWNVLPEGRYNIKIIEEWLSGPIKQAMDNLRKERRQDAELSDPNK
jgi:hypothetical protein